MSQVTITVGAEDRDALLYAVQRQIEDYRDQERADPEAFALFPADVEKLQRLLSLSALLLATRGQ
jgi:hypothetical protein